MTDIQIRVENQIGRARRALLDAYCKNPKEMYQTAKIVLDDYNRFPDKPLVPNLLIAMVKSIIQCSDYHAVERAGKAYDILLQLDLSETELEFLRKELIDSGELDRPGIRIVRMKV